MKKSILFTLSLVSFGVLNSQITNDGAMIVVQSGAIVYAQGNIENESTGEFHNAGNIYIEENWINNANAGNEMLFGDSSGTVHFVGGNQVIDGPNYTRFHNLHLDTGNVVRLNFITNGDVLVTNELHLKSGELQTDNHGMHLTNADPSSLLWDDNQGFISGEYLGSYFARSVNQNVPYMFPVGHSGLATSQYRAVEITPTSANDTGVYGVRLGLNATNDLLASSGFSMSGATAPYDLAVRSQLVKDINDEYYHNIFGIIPTANSANVNIHYFSSDLDINGDPYQTAVQWQDVSTSWQTSDPSWEDAQFLAQSTNLGTHPSIGDPDMNVSKIGVSDFMHDGFALASVNDLVLIPEFISPGNGDGFNDFWEIENIEYFEQNELKVYNRYGNLVYQKDNYDNTWDGKPNVQSGINMILGNGYLPTGTYFYTLDLKVQGVDPMVGPITIRQE